MIAVWLKLIHIAALLLWGGALLALPGLMWREYRSPEEEPGEPGELDRLEGYHKLWQHRLSRFTYDVVASPAAVTAIASGIGLIFVIRPLEGWLFVKLAAVAGLVASHMWIGRLVDLIEAPDLHPTRLIVMVMGGITLALILVILWLVLQKPVFGEGMFPDQLLRGRGGVLQDQMGSSLPLTPTR